MGAFTFGWFGKDRRGVRRITSSTRVPPLWLCLLPFIVGVFQLGFTVFASWPKLQLFQSVESILVYSPGAAFSLVGIILLRFRSNVQQLKSESEICSVLGIEPDTFRELMSHKKSRPRYNINGEDFY